MDVEAFTEQVGRVSGPRGPTLAPDKVAALRKAIELYRGDFLEGFHVRNAPGFEEWMLGEQERLRQLALQALHMLTTHHTMRGEYGAGVDYITRLLALDPWREEAHRQLMLLLARSGQRSAALAQYETCCRVLVEGLGVEPSAETTALYERIRAAPERRHNLPPRPTSFVGREEELAVMGQHLANPDCRLLTVIGPGGIGKTRLALQVAAEQVDAFLHGVTFVPLASLLSAELLAPAIADALQLPLHGREAHKVQLLNHLRDKELLLVLDNFEHLVPTGLRLLLDILRAAPEVKLLVTSRERLNLRWEWVMALDGLPYPEERLDIADWNARRCRRTIRNTRYAVRIPTGTGSTAHLGPTQPGHGVISRPGPYVPDPGGPAPGPDSC